MRERGGLGYALRFRDASKMEITVLVGMLSIKPGSSMSQTDDFLLGNM